MKSTCSPWPVTTALLWEPRSIAPRLPAKFPNRRLPAPLFGPQYSTSDIEAALHRFDDKIEWQHFDSLEATCASAAQLIADGHVIAWYRGRMEYGPRALGNRSILADPGTPKMRDRINAMVKKREAFRPFAPACSVEEAHRWFDVAPGAELPYMISVVDVRPEVRALSSCHYPRQRLRSPADRICKRQSGFSCAAAGCRRDHRSPDGAEHQL